MECQARHHRDIILAMPKGMTNYDKLFKIRLLQQASCHHHWIKIGKCRNRSFSNIQFGRKTNCFWLLKVVHPCFHFKIGNFNPFAYLHHYLVGEHFSHKAMRTLPLPKRKSTVLHRRRKQKRGSHLGFHRYSNVMNSVWETGTKKK